MRLSALPALVVLASCSPTSDDVMTNGGADSFHGDGFPRVILRDASFGNVTVFDDFEATSV
jgi:hypothetical protein